MDNIIRFASFTKRTHNHLNGGVSCSQLFAPSLVLYTLQIGLETSERSLHVLKLWETFAIYNIAHTLYS